MLAARKLSLAITDLLQSPKVDLAQLSCKLDGLSALKASPGILRDRDARLFELLVRVIKATSADVDGKLHLRVRAFALRKKWQELCRGQTKKKL